jgi:hypothetical protein
MKFSLNLFIPESVSGAVCNTSHINYRINFFHVNFYKRKTKGRGEIRTWLYKNGDNWPSRILRLSEIAPPSCTAVCASFGTEDFVQTDLLSKVMWLDGTVTPERSVEVIGWLTNLESNYLSLSVYSSFGWYLFARKVKLESFSIMIIITVKFSVFNVPNLLYDLQDGISHNQTEAKHFLSQTYWRNTITAPSISEIPAHHPAGRHFGRQLERMN